MNRTAPLVSIALPFYNAQATLAEALASIRGQSFADFEVLLIDDGSTDGSLEIARKIGDARFRVVSDGKNMGLARRLNQCATQALGRFLARMDADDIMHPQRIERQVKEMLACPDIDVLGSDAWAIDSKARILGLYPSNEPSDDPWTVVRRGIFIHPTVFGKTEWFRANRYSESCTRAEDHELWTRCCSNSCFRVLHEPLLFYRLRPPSDIAAELASARAVDELILDWGQRLARLPEARWSVRKRCAQRALWTIGALTGMRWLKRQRLLHVNPGNPISADLTQARSCNGTLAAPSARTQSASVGATVGMNDNSGEVR